MFFIAVIFVIGLSFISLLRFPNIRSRITSKFPRFRFSRLFKNKDIKILLDDRYFFNLYSSTIESKQLFIIVCRNVSNLLKAIEQDPPQQFKWIIPYEQSNLFFLLEQGKANFLFLNENLIDPEFNQNLNSRVKFLCNRICKVRKKNQINGIIYFSQIQTKSQDNSKKEKLEIQEDVKFLSEMFSFFSKNLHIKIPFYLFQYENNKTKKIGIQFHKFLEKYQNFGFYCDLSQRTDKVNPQYLKNHFNNFSISLKRICYEHNKNLASTHECLLNIGRINQAESEINEILFNHVSKFLNSFVNEEEKPSYLFIINSNLIADNFSKKIDKLFQYFSETSNQYIVISPTIHTKRTKLNRSLIGVSICVFLFSVICVCKGYNVTHQTRNQLFEIARTMKNLEDKLSDESVNEQNLNQKIDYLGISSQIQKGYHDIQSLSFKTAFLFPSWSDKITKKIQQKYLKDFSALFSEIFVQNYITLIKNEMVTSYEDTENSSEVLFNHLENLVQLFDEYQTIYPLLTSNQPEKVQQGLLIIAKRFQRIENENNDLKLFLNQISNTQYNALTKLNETVSNHISTIVMSTAQKYLDSVFINSEFMNALFNFNYDLNEFDHLVSKIKKDSNEQIENSLYLKNAFIHLFNDYESVLNLFNHQIHSLSSANQLLNVNYPKIINIIKEGPLYDDFLSSKIENEKDRSFKKYLENLSKFTTTSQPHFIPILSINENSEITIHSSVLNLFSLLARINNIYPFDSKVNLSDDIDDSSKEFFVDIEKSELNFFDNIKLKNIIKNQTEFEEIFEKLTTYESSNEFSTKLHHFLLEYAQEELALRLSSALVPIDNSIDYALKEQSDPYQFVLNQENFKELYKLFLKPHYKKTLSKFENIFLIQVNNYLKNKTKTLYAKNLFGSQINKIEYWDGIQSPLSSIFNLSAKGSLENTYSAQKRTLYEYYTQQVEKQFKAINDVFEQNSHLISDQFRLWQSIQKNYEETLNSSQELDQFILEDLSKMNVDNCPNFLNIPDTRNFETDYFLVQKNHIQTLIHNRCYELFMNQSLKAYDIFAQKFNEYLANRYPFVNRHQDSISVQMASVSHTNNLLSEFRRFKKDNWDFLLSHNAEFANRADIQNFLKNIDSFQEFLSKYVNVDNENKNIYVKTLFEFRTHKKQEVLANRIVDWELKSGQKSYGSLFGNLEVVEFYWEFGSPITLTFNLDESVSLKSLNNLRNGMGLMSKNRQISYSSLQEWSLFRLIDAYSDTRSTTKNTLSFEIPLKNGEKIVLFCDISFLDESGNKVSKMTLPFSAPYFVKQTSNF